MGFQGQKIVIIGGSSGIGLATAKMAEAGDDAAVIAGRSKDKLDKAKVEIRACEDEFAVTLLETSRSQERLSTFPPISGKAR